jgi:hypothetical protein
MGKEAGPSTGSGTSSGGVPPAGGVKGKLAGGAGGTPAHHTVLQQGPKAAQGNKRPRQGSWRAVWRCSSCSGSWRGLYWRTCGPIVCAHHGVHARPGGQEKQQGCAGPQHTASQTMRERVVGCATRGADRQCWNAVRLRNSALCRPADLERAPPQGAETAGRPPSDCCHRY